MVISQVRAGVASAPVTRVAGFGRRRMLGFVAISAAFVGVLVLSLSIGSRDVDFADVWQALLGGASNAEARDVLELRVPRTVLGVLVGAALGVGGALIQAVTRNPLADPGILGVNAGSAFAVAIAVGVFGVTAPTDFIWFAFGGALVAAVVVFFVGSAGRGTVSPARITLAGVSLGAVLTGITSAMVLANPRGYNAMRAWEAGTLADRGWSTMAVAAPYVIIGLVAAILLGRPLNAVALGDDLARSLGSRVVRTRVFAIVAITLLCGAATAMAGPIAFVGLMIPHVARWLVGPDQRWIIAYSALLAPVLLLAADVLGRVIMPPGELQVSIVTAVIGAPVLIVLVRRQRASAL
ncbi:iron chelate uptake ABC transporter family permease subunit [Leucobacter sp. NPDC058333]|uniref:iron chelate uptake ABC transporter family permease subunit n=1 Tax=Leucobacter sp. NPDC058333 TaxID=3346450 RepID=UPI003659E210